MSSKVLKSLFFSYKQFLSEFTILTDSRKWSYIENFGNYSYEFLVNLSGEKRAVN